MSLAKEMDQQAERLFKTIAEKDVVCVEFVLKRLPGGLKTTEFHVRVGDVMQPGYVLEMEQSLELAVEKCIETVSKSRWWEKKRAAWLHDEAAKLGYKLVAKGGGK